MYTGKRPGEEGVKGLGAQVVLGLTKKSKLAKGSVVVFDRVFGGIEVLLMLQKLGYYGICTIMQNRKGFPKR